MSAASISNSPKVVNTIRRDETNVLNCPPLVNLVVVNGIHPKYGVPQGSVLRPLLFLIYINDLPDGITSVCKIFADDTSLFTKVLDIYESTNKLNTDLKKITKWAHQWKMQFNPDPNKQANEVIFSRKATNNLSYPPVRFNNNDTVKCPDQKHLGIVLDSKLNFDSHINQKIKKCNKLIGVIRRFQYIFLEVRY